jgi:UDP-N-acetylmuramoylalanine--D-glutamate ligase
MKKVLVWGLGKSGRSAVKLLESKGFEVFSGDDARGDRWEDLLPLVDTLVLSPGIPPSHPLWKKAQSLELEVIGELELAWRFFEGKVIAVTGTDGKSTTVSLIYEMLKSAGLKARTAGNIGTPFSDVALNDPRSIAVVEVSSFQGKTLKTFRPSVGCFLNFHPDHLDWHPTLEDYLKSKQRIFINQREDDLFIAGSVQREVLSTPTRARKVLAPEEKIPLDFSRMKLRGAHNLSNAKVASIAAMRFGVEPEAIQKVLEEFEGLPFRMEKVGTFRGAEIYNDSKSTTPNSLRAALESFPDRSVVLIAGGKDKGADFGFLRGTVRKKVKACFLIGEARFKIKESWDSSCEIFLSESLSEAVEKAARILGQGDFLLFSPGCSSFDMFENYVRRGEKFNEIVRNIIRSGNG